MAYKKILALILVFFLTSLILMPTSLSLEGESAWYEKLSSWSYRQKIKTPYDTSLEGTSFQPVDITIKFDNPCWAKDSDHHSLRVIYHNKGVFKELESQIYELNYSSENIISSCNLVFLIPENADGNEEYYVYYDEEDKGAANYLDHVSIEESYYRYEPVQGLFLESWYYAVKDEEFIIYAVSQKGETLNDPISQQVLKLKRGTKLVQPESCEQAVSFNFVYWWFKNNEWNFISTSEKLVSKKIILDGNLMVKFALVSQSSDGSLQSTVYYTYYFSPLDEKNIYTNVRHEILKHPLPEGDEIDVSFAIFTSGALKSSKIDELNFGSIPPYLHFYNEENRVITHEIDITPEDVNWQTVISKQDDYDVGSFPWVTVDYGEKDKAYGVIFDSIDVVESGEDERNGIELQLFQSNSIQLPAINGCFSHLYFMRNDFEENEKLDSYLPKNYVVSFNANFFSTDKGGFKAVEKEAGLYQSFIDYQPANDKELENGEDLENKEYEIEVYTHLPPSLFLKMIGSKCLFKNSYVRVELYSQGVLKGFIRSGHVGFTEEYWIDLRNVSFFRKAIFPNQDPGLYIVKVYLENLYFSDREFIGYSIVDLTKDTTTHIVCKPECDIDLSVSDQNGNYVENVEIEVLSEDTVILKTNTGSDEKNSFGLPGCLTQDYQLRLIYKGFLVAQEEIKTGLLNKILPYKKTFNLSLYDFFVQIKNSNDEDIDLDISLTSNNMLNQVYIKPDSVSNNIYSFKSLPASEYNLIIKYDSLEFEEKINVPEQIQKDINLYDIKLRIEDLWGLAPDADLDIILTCEDFEKPVTIYGSCISNQEYFFPYIYPGDYKLKMYYKSYLFEQDFKIPVENGFSETIIFPVSFNLFTRFYDSHGGILSNGRVVLSRDGKNQSKDIDSDGNVLFNVPPGVYTAKVYDKENLIAERKIDVLNDKNLDFVTTNVSTSLIVYFVLLIVFFVGFSILCFKNKRYVYLLKIIVVFLALTSIVLPWWSINCNSNEHYVKTSTNLYINSADMITITQATNVSAGYFSTLDETFVLAINIVSLLAYAGVFLIILSLILRHFLNKKKLSLLCVLLSIIVFLSSIGLFVYSMSEFANATVGRLTGYGNLDVDIVGENIFEQVSCNWGLGFGFIVFAVVLVLSFCVLFLEKKKSY